MVREIVKQFKAYSPGLSISEIKKRYKLQKVIKLASNENPLGISPLVIDTVKKRISECYRYPRPNSPALQKAIAEHLQLSEKQIVIGNGSDEIIDLLIRGTAEPGKNNIVLFKPSFSIYRMQGLLHGITIKQVPLNRDFSFPLDKLTKTIDQNTSLVFLTTPDNPSGFALPRAEVLQLAQQLPNSTLLVIDEAYIDFADPAENFTLFEDINKFQNIVILRTFSKIYALAGFRVGFAIAPRKLADYLMRIKLPFSVNHLAEHAAVAALKDRLFYEKSRKMVINERIKLQKELNSLQCTTYPSQANFLMFTPPVSAEYVFQGLLKKGIIIRPLKSYGLEDNLRVTIGTSEENTIFINALSEVLTHK